MSVEEARRIRWFEDLSSEDTPTVGGKNSSLGEMIRTLESAGIRVPGGFATTAEAYRELLEENDLHDRIGDELARLQEDDADLPQVGKAIRQAILEAKMPEVLASEIRDAYRELSRRYETEDVDVAVRSSATAEDLPDASFAGQQETFLNICGEEELLRACQRCYASLFTDRAISYREKKGFDHLAVALSVGVQKMVRSDRAGAGVAFTLDPETGFPDVVVINANWGLGETVVAGTVNPDEYRVFKPLLEVEGKKPIIETTRGEKEHMVVYAEHGEEPTREVETPAEQRDRLVLEEERILELARWATRIEEHYGRPMDIEWAVDGLEHQLYIVQARPETVRARERAGKLYAYSLEEKGERLLEGLAIGSAIASGKAFVLGSIEEADRFEKGGILVTSMTDPDWGPVLKRAAGIVTDHGGRTSHAAIVSRELGVPAIVGTGEATSKLESGQEVTLSCAEGDHGFVYDGCLEYSEKEIDPESLPKTETKVMTILASPDAAFRWWRLPTRGVGLARMEFIINNIIKIHPLALTRFDRLEDEEARRRIEELTAGYEDPTEYFVENLARGMARIAAAHHPQDVIVRLSDFKTNEYANLIGGRQFEPEEENPMLGFRGASRYYSERYRDGFALECRAIRRARNEIGLSNIVVMVPFCRTPAEADRVLEVMEENGLVRGQDELRIYVMAEIPSNIILAEQFAERFDGFSIGSNDLTQLVLGIDRDSDELASLFDERQEAVTRSIRQLIETAHRLGKPVGICGQAPSDHPDFAELLVEAGIDSISVNPDSVVEVMEHIAAAEERRGK